MNKLAVQIIECAILGGGQVFARRLAAYAERWSHACLVMTANGDYAEDFAQVMNPTLWVTPDTIGATLAQLNPDLIIWHHWGGAMETIPDHITTKYKVLAFCHGKYPETETQTPIGFEGACIGGATDWNWDRAVRIMPAIVPYGVFGTLHTPSDNFRVMTYARLQPNKNGLGIIRLWKEVGVATGGHLTIYAGPHMVASDYREQCLSEAAADPSITIDESAWPGSLPYSYADAFLSYSTAETCSLVTAEAMAAGMPVVARNRFGPREYGPGVMSLVETERDAAQALIELCMDRGRGLELGRLAKRRAWEMFAPCVSIPQYEAVFEEVAG